MDMKEEYENEYKENNKLKGGKYSNVLYCIFIIEYLQLDINLLYGNQHKNVTFQQNLQQNEFCNGLLNLFIVQNGSNSLIESRKLPQKWKVFVH